MLITIDIDNPEEIRKLLEFFPDSWNLLDNIHEDSSIEDTTQALIEYSKQYPSELYALLGPMNVLLSSITSNPCAYGVWNRSHSDRTLDISSCYTHGRSVLRLNETKEFTLRCPFDSLKEFLSLMDIK